ncbi:hypothetical protein DSO57_1002883 [Entomophthora muscae]|uniref:Uncharacterized protein n=1 Tax=Entomophthora muscae TaxID=34485 RepID=A0ACC2TWG3_9FUNG|nr:hypothetical protein DSO57_1002883 [Entomophthora muscae]
MFQNWVILPFPYFTIDLLTSYPPQDDFFDNLPTAPQHSHLSAQRTGSPNPRRPPSISIAQFSPAARGFSPGSLISEGRAPLRLNASHTLPGQKPEPIFEMPQLLAPSNFCRQYCSILKATPPRQPLSDSLKKKILQKQISPPICHVRKSVFWVCGNGEEL